MLWTVFLGDEHGLKVEKRGEGQHIIKKQQLNMEKIEEVNEANYKNRKLKKLEDKA